MKGTDLGPAKFTCYLRGKLANHEPRSLTLMRVAKSKQDDQEHAHLDLVDIDAAAPGTSGCFLQVWEADHFAAHYTTIGESPKAVRANRLIGSIPGAVVVHGGGHKFISHGALQHGHPPDERNGSVTLTLTSASGAAQDVVMHLPDYEGVLELFAVIKMTSTSADLVSFKHGKPHQVHNIRATLLRQIERRGGIHVAVVADYNFDSASSNDKEFRRQADSMVPQLPSIMLQDGTVAFGRYEVTGRDRIALALAEARGACRSFLGLAAAPHVGSLAIYAHGIPRGLKIDRTGYDSDKGLTIPNIRDFVASNRPHFSQTVVIALFACNSGRGGGMDANYIARRGKKPALAIYGRVPIGEEIGGGSFAWRLTRELVRQGVATPTVWAHTIAAHTTRNRRLRVFSPLGSADFPSLLYGVRAPDDATLGAYISRTDNNTHRLNLIRMVHLHSAMYMPWAWAGPPVNSSHPGYNTAAAQEARALLDELRAEIAGADTFGGERPETVELNDQGTHILGSLLYGPDARTVLSEHFTLEDFTRFDGALPLPLDLVRKLQLLRHDIVSPFEVTALSREPGSRAIRLTLKAAAASRAALMAHARKMRDAGLCFVAVDEGAAADEFVVACQE